VGGRAVNEDIAEFAFGAGLEVEVEEEGGGRRHGSGVLDGEFDADGIVGKIESAQLGPVGLEEHSEIGAAPSSAPEDGKRNAVEAEVAKGVGEGSRKARKADDVVEISEVHLSGDGGSNRLAGDAAKRR